MPVGEAAPIAAGLTFVWYVVWQIMLRIPNSDDDPRGPRGPRRPV